MMRDRLSPKAQAFLESVLHDDDPIGADCERVLARLEARLGLGVATGAAAGALTKSGAATAGTAAPATGAATSGAGSALMIKLGVGVVVAGVAAGGAFGITRHTHGALPVASSATVASMPPRTSAPVSMAPIVAEAPPIAPPSEPRRDTPAAPVKHRSITARSGASVPSAVPPPSALDAEIAFLRAAHAARGGGDAAGALAILQEYDGRFPDGALGEDSAAERIYALCALGRIDDARSLARKFVAARPSSPHLAAVRSSCAFTGRN